MRAGWLLKRQGKSSESITFTDISSFSANKATLPTQVPLGKNEVTRVCAPEANLGPKTDLFDLTENEVDENAAKECL